MSFTNIINTLRQTIVIKKHKLIYVFCWSLKTRTHTHMCIYTYIHIDPLTTRHIKAMI